MRKFKLSTLSQSGRTMLEILIVVTLVGLLSLLPLEIYNWAIDKYRSNVLKDELLQRSVDLRKQIDNHKQTFNLDKWDPYSKIGVPINLIQNDEHETDSIGIQTMHVEERICNMTLDGLDHLETIRVNDILYTADVPSLCKGNDKITLYFNPMPNRKIRKSLEHCPTNTPKNADPNTCKCNLEERYLSEATNECICWSEAEIDGECVNSCTTSADCDKNEVCENHVCVKYDNTTTMEPIYTSTPPETTMPETTTPETTTPETTTPETTTPETTMPETTTPATTTPETTTLYETTTIVWGVHTSMSPTYPVHLVPKSNIRLQ